MLVKFKIDTGASCNCLPYNVFKQIDLPNGINKDAILLSTYGNHKIQAMGKVITKCYAKGVDCNLKFIVDVKSTPVLGLNTCMKLNLIQKVDTVTTFLDSKKMLIAKYKNVLRVQEKFLINTT